MPDNELEMISLGTCGKCGAYHGSWEACPEESDFDFWWRNRGDGVSKFDARAIAKIAWTVARAPKLRPSDGDVECPNPECDEGLIRGTSVGCAVCQQPHTETPHLRHDALIADLLAETSRLRAENARHKAALDAIQASGFAWAGEEGDAYGFDARSTQRIEALATIAVEALAGSPDGRSTP